MNDFPITAPAVLENPAISTLIHLLQAFRLPFAKSEVREHLAAATSFPYLSVEDISRALEHWGIGSVVVEAEISALGKLPMPALAFVSIVGIAGGATPAKLFVVLERIGDTTLSIVHPVVGKIECSYGEFASIWSGILLLVDLDSASVRFSAAAFAREQAENHRYGASITCHHAFLRPEECDQLIAYAEAESDFHRSEIQFAPQGNAFDEVLNASRTSWTSFLKDDTSIVIQETRARAADLLGCDAEHIEPLQCARYQPGQEFRPHFDASDCLRRHETLLVYLNDDFTGGETLFPEIGLQITPRKGSALRFPNISAEGGLIPQALHAGCPIKTGIKYVCNIWTSVL